MAQWLHDAQYSLVLFTLFTQASVGAFWVLLVSDFLKRKAPDKIQDAFTRIGTMILIPLTALGLIFSTTHLGRPQYAFRALAHVDSSWLSREVLAFGLFFGLIALYTYLWWRRVPDGELRHHVGVITGIVGLLAILSQAMVYQIPGRPMWNHISTTILFGASGLLLGPLAVAAVYSFSWGRYIDLTSGEETVRVSHQRLGITLLTGALAYAVGLFWRMSYLSTGAAAAAGDSRVLDVCQLHQRIIEVTNPVQDTSAVTNKGLYLPKRMWPLLAKFTYMSLKEVEFSEDVLACLRLPIQDSYTLLDLVKNDNPGVFGLFAA